LKLSNTIHSVINLKGGRNEYDLKKQQQRRSGTNKLAHEYLFEKALDQHKERSSWMLGSIQKLCQIEHDVHNAGLSYADRYCVCQEKSVPILVVIKKWLDQSIACIACR